jgi:RNA polymerase sigma-70 factor (ECF subfamily)
MSTTPLENLLDKLSGGDMEAAEQVFREYEPYLRLVVHRMLPASLRPKFDSVDVVQSVWADLLDGFRDASWRFQDVAHLRAFLVRATRNRFIARVRQNKRAAAAEQPFDDFSPAQQRIDADARPSELAQANELWEHMLGLCSDTQRPLLELKRRGCSLAEISAKTGMHPSSIRRIFYDLARRVAARDEPCP